MDSKTLKLQENFPFLSYGTYMEEEYLGIVQNCDTQFLSMYVYNHIHDDDLKRLFLNFVEIWWWETNRQLPINLYIKTEFKIFKPYLAQFNRKEFKLVHGPIVCLTDTMAKRSKKKQIQLVKDMAGSHRP